MKELSLNILDIAMNSLKAGATTVTITIDESDTSLTFTIADDGCGMSAAQVAKLSDPFFTTRTTRKVGLGVPFLKLAAMQSGGDVTVTSRPRAEYPDNCGTEVCASFDKTNIDFTPLGDIVATLVTLIQGSPQVHLVFTHRCGEHSVSLDTAQLRDILGPDVPLDSLEVLNWVSQYLQEQYQALSSRPAGIE